MFEEINERLASRYGTTLTGLPHFRLVYSNDLYEIRVGKFNEFYKDIFLREYIGPKRVRKYNYINDRWMLEMWKLEHTQPTKELPLPDGYECLYLFQDAKGNALPVIWKVIELICFSILNPKLDSAQIKEAIDAAQIKIEQDDLNYFDDMFRDSISYEMNKFHFKERILLPGKDF